MAMRDVKNTMEESAIIKPKEQKKGMLQLHTTHPIEMDKNPKVTIIKLRNMTTFLQQHKRTIGE
jgi:hypothetical protein